MLRKAHIATFVRFFFKLKRIKQKLKENHIDFFNYSTAYRRRHKNQMIPTLISKKLKKLLFYLEHFY